MLEKKTVLVQWYVFLHIIIEHQYKHRRLFKRFQCGILPYFFSCSHLLLVSPGDKMWSKFLWSEIRPGVMVKSWKKLSMETTILNMYYIGFHLTLMRPD